MLLTILHSCAHNTVRPAVLRPASAIRLPGRTFSRPLWYHPWALVAGTCFILKRNTCKWKFSCNNNFTTTEQKYCSVLLAKIRNATQKTAKYLGCWTICHMPGLNNSIADIHLISSNVNISKWAHDIRTVSAHDISSETTQAGSVGLDRGACSPLPFYCIQEE